MPIFLLPKWFLFVEEENDQRIEKNPTLASKLLFLLGNRLGVGDGGICFPSVAFEPELRRRKMWRKP